MQNKSTNHKVNQCKVNQSESIQSHLLDAMGRVGLRVELSSHDVLEQLTTGHTEIEN